MSNVKFWTEFLIGQCFCLYSSLDNLHCLKIRNECPDYLEGKKCAFVRIKKLLMTQDKLPKKRILCEALLFTRIFSKKEIISIIMSTYGVLYTYAAYTLLLTVRALESKGYTIIKEQLYVYILDDIDELS